MIRNCILVVMASVFFSFLSRASEYEIDDVKMDLKFEQAEDITISSMNPSNGEVFPFGNVFPNYVSSGDVNKELLAGILSLVVPFFTWPVPIHRLMVGVNGQEAKIWAAYCFTFGGCGVISLVDAVLLIIDGANDGSKYVGNTKFIMW